ncbi:unnamed protein product [Allacma fusca]|uniref:G-protein coupled receptors family 1 profile domain-containing protein n=1 Tax=Allacma fusca TaxID=39272 RepID=A0A8J2P6I1_9HEXA|nr:unnamed protein product [Allacma fusca]
MILLYVKIYYAIRDRIRAKAKVAVMSEPEPSGDELTDTSGNGNSEASSAALKVRTVSAVSRNNSILGRHIKDFLAKKQKFSLTKERKAAKTLGIIIGAFVVCWLPFCLMYVMAPILTEYCGVAPPDPEVFEFLTWMGYLNSGLNPIIYTVYNQEFRKAFKRVLHLT